MWEFDGYGILIHKNDKTLTALHRHFPDQQWERVEEIDHLDLIFAEAEDKILIGMAWNEKSEEETQEEFTEMIDKELKYIFGRQHIDVRDIEVTIDIENNKIFEQ